MFDEILRGERTDAGNTVISGLRIKSLAQKWAEHKAQLVVGFQDGLYMSSYELCPCISLLLIPRKHMHRNAFRIA